MNEYESIPNSRNKSSKEAKSRACIIISLIVISFCVAMISLIIIVIVSRSEEKHSKMGKYKSAAITTDVIECSTIAKDILLKNGSAMDAAIASLFCLGIFNFHSCGVGGGAFIIVHDRLRYGGVPQFLTFDSRETAPLKATKFMFTNENASKFGGLSIAVPSEVKGYHEAWLKFGRLPWPDLIKPSIKLCREGFALKSYLANYLRIKEELVRSSPGLSQLFLDEMGRLKKEGDVIKMEKLGRTLERISENPGDFYNGSLARDIVEDIKEANGIIDMEDLQKYEVRMAQPFRAYIPNSRLTLYTLPPPSGGPILAFMLRVLDSYNMSSDGVDGIRKLSDTYQKMVEILKFGGALKTHMGDNKFVDNKKVFENISSDDFINSIRSLITLNTTHPLPYYNPHPGDNNLEDGGTSHVNIVAQDGGLVSATSTINLAFASAVVGSRTGILFNDEMDDFTIPLPSAQPSYGQNNFIEPGKRPLSSMAPSILLDDSGRWKFLIGGSGGAKITPAIFFVLANRLWLGRKLANSIDVPRLHHQFVPDVVVNEEGFDKNILKELTQKGHAVEELEKDAVHSVILAIENLDEGPLTSSRSKLEHSESGKFNLLAVSDWRKNGKPDGF